MNRPYFLIQPDFSCCVGCYSKDNCSYFCNKDMIELEGYENNPFRIPGIDQWYTDWKIMNDCRIHKKPWGCINLTHPHFGYCILRKRYSL